MAAAEKFPLSLAALRAAAALVGGVAAVARFHRARRNGLDNVRA
jgi:hypothetical protein